MKTMLGAVAGAVAVCAVLVAYDLGDKHTFTQGVAATSMGYQQGQAYLAQAGQAGYVTPYAPYATPLAAPFQYGVAPGMPMAGMPMAGYATPQYVNQQAVTTQPVARRTSFERPYTTERVSRPAPRSWQRSALLIGGSAAGAAGVGALIGGKKGAGIGALLGGGTAAIYDQIKRH
jgi:hypothetical protein